MKTRKPSTVAEIAGARAKGLAEGLNDLACFVCASARPTGAKRMLREAVAALAAWPADRGAHPREQRRALDDLRRLSSAKGRWGPQLAAATRSAGIAYFGAIGVPLRSGRCALHGDGCPG